MVRVHTPVLACTLHPHTLVQRPRKHARDTVCALLVSAFVAIVVAGSEACGEGSGAIACLPQDVIRCACADGRQGFAVCDADGGAGYGPCACGGASPFLPEAGSASLDAASGGDAGGLQFLSPCNPADDQCPPGTSCDAFPARGPHCSKQ